MPPTTMWLTAAGATSHPNSPFEITSFRLASEQREFEGRQVPVWFNRQVIKDVFWAAGKRCGCDSPMQPCAIKYRKRYCR